LRVKLWKPQAFRGLTFVWQKLSVQLIVQVAMHLHLNFTPPQVEDRLDKSV